ncbi:unnamed protein product [Danaus chrysippus]|uniref:(African queen) hypothetical protein n=1 Tax=Danaus chrysippus TaxID=151541 RepID=A0A8J2QVU5_9NEOP|nr:unnamed protein product [Danaus chrysippus]
MKSFLAILIVVLAVQSAEIRSSRSNLNIGSVRPYDRLLQRTFIYQPARPNAIQYQDYMFRGNSSVRISGLFVNEVGYTQYGTVSLLAGGIGYSNVTVRIQSAKGYGYYYQLDVWGRSNVLVRSRSTMRRYIIVITLFLIKINLVHLEEEKVMEDSDIISFIRLYARFLQEIRTRRRHSHGRTNSRNISEVIESHDKDISKKNCENTKPVPLTSFAAFAGDKCATGYVKINGLCAEVD